MTNTAYQVGSTDVTVYVRGFTASTGLPYTAGAFNTSGITCQYIRNRSASSGITLVTQTATGTHTDGGFVHVNGGVYRLDLPDVVFDTGVNDVQIAVYGVADVVFTMVRIDLLTANPRATVMDANIKQVNNVSISGVGTTATPWGP